MVALSIALRYLVPRRRNLSTALISLVSVCVISLVVWLALLFLSVTAGIERGWLDKLTALHAPLRVCPTEAYYSSYFYRIDAVSATSGFTPKTLGEKLSLPSDPYRPEIDAPLHPQFPRPLQGAEGSPRHLAGEAWRALQSLPGIAVGDYEIGGALLRIQLGGSQLSQMAFLLSYSSANPRFPSLLLPPPPGAPYAAHVVDGQVVFPDEKGVAPVLAPKQLQASGVQVGDRGALHYTSYAPFGSQEQLIQVRVAGFYDPGLVPAGGRCLVVPAEITRTIHAATHTFSPDGTPTNGFFVWCRELSEVGAVKARVAQALEEQGLAPYFTVTDYAEYEFAKDLIGQFRSDKTLFLLIAILILLVASSNIASLLILLVNDKRKEIAILQALGASRLTIGAIFAVAGTVIGTMSCLLGIGAAWLTLYRIDLVVFLLSQIQGRSPFHPAFFGSQLPNTFSGDALLFVSIATPLLSLAAGLVPAWRAMRHNPSTALRS